MTSFLLECLHFPPLWLVSVPRLKGVIVLKGLMGLRDDTEIGFVMVGGGGGVGVGPLKGIVHPKLIFYPCTPHCCVSGGSW